MPPRRPPLHRLAALLAALAVGLPLLAGCGSDPADGATAGPSTTAAPVTVPTSIPEGTVLRVGDQLEYLQTVLELAGEDQDFPYVVEYSAFVGGPPMLQAFQAGAIDTGFVASTPLIFAQAGQQDIVAIGGWATKTGGYELVTAPGEDDIDGWEDLEGRSVAFQKGTALESAVLKGLDSVGLSLADITPVDLPTPQIAAALQSGSADAGILIEPLTSAYLETSPTAVVVTKSTDITDRASFAIATQEALADDATTAALADYLGRVIRSFTYLADHPEAIARAVYVETYGLSPERAQEIVEGQGGFELLDLPDDVVEEQQRLADLYVAAGEIPEELDVTAQFDGRFAAVAAEAAGG